MLDLGFVRDNLDLIRRKMRERGLADTLDGFENLDRERRKLLAEAEGYKARRNKVSGEIAALKKNKQDALNSKLRISDIWEVGTRDADSIIIGAGFATANRKAIRLRGNSRVTRRTVTSSATAEQ